MICTLPLLHLACKLKYTQKSIFDEYSYIPLGFSTSFLQKLIQSHVSPFFILGSRLIARITFGLRVHAVAGLLTYPALFASTVNHLNPADSRIHIYMGRVTYGSHFRRFLLLWLILLLVFLCLHAGRYGDETRRIIFCFAERCAVSDKFRVCDGEKRIQAPYHHLKANRQPMQGPLNQSKTFFWACNDCPAQFARTKRISCGC